jgi:hypothetical protein
VMSAYMYVSIRQHTSAYVSIRQHTSAYVSTRHHTSAYTLTARPPGWRLHTCTSAYFSIREHTLAYVTIREHTSSYVSIRQHTLRQHARQGDVCIYIGVSTCTFVLIKQVSWVPVEFHTSSPPPCLLSERDTPPPPCSHSPYIEEYRDTYTEWRRGI